MGLVTLLAAFSAGTIPTMLAPMPAVAAGQECGWSSEGGKLVFHGTCAHENGDSSEPTDAPPATNPCLGKLNGPVYTYRLQIVTGC